MKKQLLLLLILLFTYTFQSFSQPDPDFHIYLLFGQSNMEGRGIIEAQDTIQDPRIMVLQDMTCDSLKRTYGQWYVAKPPLNRCKLRLGPGDNFGKVMAAGNPDSVKIGLVVAAVSGTKIELFQKSAPIDTGLGGMPPQFKSGYDWLIDLAKTAQKSGVIKGILMHQGESNAGEEDWKYRVQEIVKDLKQDLGLGDVPFLAGEMLYTEKGGDAGAHNMEVNKLPGLIPNCSVISAEGLEGTDVFHFTTSSYRELGRRYASRLLSIAGVSPKNIFDGSNLQVQISPLPFKESLSIDFLNLDISNSTIKIYEANGRVVFNTTINFINTFTIPTSHISPNMYFIEITQGRNKIVRKISKVE